MTKDEALRLALEALEYLATQIKPDYEHSKASTAIKAALEAKDEPVPVAIVEVFGKDWRLDYMALPVGKHKLYAQQYTYTTPPQRKPLTDEEIQGVVNNACLAGTLSWMGYKADDEGKYTIPVLSPSNYQFARAIEAAHGIKGEA